MHGLLLSLYVSYDWKQRCIPPARGLDLFLTLLSAMLKAFLFIKGWHFHWLRGLPEVNLWKLDPPI